MNVVEVKRDFQIFSWLVKKRACNFKGIEKRGDEQLHQS